MTDQRKILVVDDDEAVRSVTFEMLKRLGFDVTTADSGASALEEVSHQSFDLVLLDLRLPKLSGFEVLERIRASESVHRLPVVILSSSDAAQDVGRAYDSRANSYVVKPLEFEGFQALMRELSSYWLTRNRSPWM